MDPGKLEYYEFLDLSDIDENERQQLKQTLYSTSTPDFLQLPWTNHNFVTEEWQKDSYEVEVEHVPNGPVEEMGVCDGGDLVGQGQVAQHLPAVTMYSHPQPPPYSMPPPSSGYQHPQNVFVSNVTANVNVHGYMTGHYVQPHYTLPEPPPDMGRGHRGRSRGRGNKRNDVRMEPAIETSSAPGFSQQFVPIHPYHPAAYYTQPVGSPMQHPNAQHATGSPLYIAPVYTHMYGAYHPHTAHQYYPAPATQHVNAIMEDSADIPLDQPIYQHQPAEEDYDSNVVATTVIVNSSMDPINCDLKSDSANAGYMNNGNNVIPEVHENVFSKPVTVICSVGIVKTEPADVKISFVTNNNNINKPLIEEDSVTDTFSGDTVNTVNAIVIPPEVVQLQPQVQQYQQPPPQQHQPPPSQHHPPPPQQPTAPQHQQPTAPQHQQPTAPQHQQPTAPQQQQPAPPQQQPAPPQQQQPAPPQQQQPAPPQQQQPAPPQHPQQSVVEPPGATPVSAPVPVNNTQPEPAVRVDRVDKISKSVEESVHAEPEAQEPAPIPTPGKSWASLFNKSRSPAVAAPHRQTTTQQHQVVDIAKSATGKPSAYVNPFPKPEDRQTEKSEPKPTNSNLSMYSNDPISHRMGEFLTKYSLDNRTVSLQPRGLTNRSNYCYINSILQALLACPPFYNLLKALPHQQRKNANAKSPTPIIDSMVEFVNEFTPLSAESRLNRKEKGQRKENIDVICGIAFEPARIYKILNGIRTDTFIVEGRQEDAEEFFGCLLNGLNDEMLELTKLVDGQSHQIMSNGDIATNGESHEQDEEWTVMGPKNKGSITRRADFGRTPISDIFRGQLRSRVHRTGDQVTDNVQPFFTLLLDIEKTNSVYEALELLVNKDKLEGVTCSRTNQQVEAWQQVTIEELPLVMVLHLKCFNYKLDACSKIIKALEFPIDLKIDSKLLSSKAKYTGKQKQYKLFAVVYHDGKEASKGHYLTDAYHVGYGGWVRYDDAVVKSVQENNVLHPNAVRVPYLLFYRRCDTIGNQQQNSKRD